MEVLDYISFAKEPLDQRIDFVDTYPFIQQKSGIVSRRFLHQIFEQESNTYIRKKSLQTICELTFNGKIRLDGTKSFLFEEVDSNDDEFIVLTKLKYLFILLGDDYEVYSEFEQTINSANLEIKAEAHYRLGLIHLLYRSSNMISSVSIDEIRQANNHFNIAEALSENRIDAKFFQKIADILLSVVCEDFEKAQSIFKIASQLLWERSIFDTQPVNRLLEWHIYKAINKVIQVGQHLNDVEKWYDLSKELTVLLNYLNDFLGLEALNTNFRKQDTARPDIITHLMDNVCNRNLSSSLLRIKTLESDLGENETEFKQFLRQLIEKIGTSPSEKKNVNLISILQVHFSGIDSSKIMTDFQTYRNKGLSDGHIALILSKLYHEQQRHTTQHFETGYQLGDEIFNQIAANLSNLLPQYPAQKMVIFQTILSDLIRYLVQSQRYKQSFEVLYESKIQAEKTFQEHLFQRLIQGHNAQYYKYESTHIVGGGRVDIVFECENIVYPIEVKKSDTVLNWLQIQDGYLRQVQTYTGSHHQIGILVNFDQAPKKDVGAVNDVRELVQILSVPPVHKLSGKYPDYIVAIIIPAGKVSPNIYSKYQ